MKITIYLLANLVSESELALKSDFVFWFLELNCLLLFKLVVGALEGLVLVLLKLELVAAAAAAAPKLKWSNSIVET